mmetsp:Transcript_10807/g.35805  ORF Transcript_10807/g.35805 Transcript_10807/m.35805 type:complete len:481 (+) Transcript_10807:100-1542(+)|eukprot:CAMPEP_0118919910 /NCGR_PEP_ID=MMETSP1166-20130328/18799_1 /TAXON_ID=1104430 /ORGANISM="Chrysoreinhardia sp, Strain CCMP3193" /LENGTH=480 /DNA_ID=CAMNT_0006860445 /DNA_START=36 /DNA_END=1478 /DNA_ORIENTATION=-
MAAEKIGKKMKWAVALFFWSSSLGVVAAGRCPSCSSESMCECRGFEASSFRPDTVLSTTTSGDEVYTCREAQERCDLKYAVVCCGSDESLSLEEEEEDAENVYERKLQTVLEFETADEFCSRNSQPLEKAFEPHRVAYPGSGTGPTGFTVGSCGNVVADAEDLFAECCCTDEAYCCPQGADSDDCDATKGVDVLQDGLLGGSYSYSYVAGPEDPDVADLCPDSTGLDRSVCLENGGHDDDCCAVAGNGCEPGYSMVLGHSCEASEGGSVGSFTCCYEGCADDATWHKKGDTTKDCAWVGEKAVRCTNSRNDDGVAAEYACPVTCGTTCLDSKTWYKRGDPSKDCAWVSVFPQKRCELKGDDQTVANYSCPLACDLLHQEADSMSWYKNGDPSKNCAWASVLPSKRCDAKGFDGTYASYGCPVACGVDLSLTDNAAWYKTNDPSKDCAWVSTFAAARCSVNGWNGEAASTACPRACYGTRR